jgi:predicted DNA-binding protein with PD1-like motif
MQTLPMRLLPGQDLRKALEAEVTRHGCTAAFVLSGIGSLDPASLRLAGAEVPQVLAGDFEIVALAGTIAANGSHLHAVLAASDGSVLGGHVAYGCTVRTTAEVLLALLPAWDFRREADAATGYDELVVRKR